MRAPRLTSRLAAKQGIRQIEAHTKADAVANAVDRGIASAWQDVLRFLKRSVKPGVIGLSPVQRREAIELFRVVDKSVHTFLGKSLKSLVGWGHRSAVAVLWEELPERVGQVAAVLGVEDDDRSGSSGRSSGLLRRELVVHHLGIPESLARVRRSGEEVPRNAGQRERQLQEDISDGLSSLLFPSPTPDEVNAIVYAGDWRARLAAGTRLASPDLLASILSQGMIAGKNPQELARELLPHVEKNRASARRVARTESLRVASATQMRCHAHLGPLVIGYQVHATLDQHTRTWHAARSGTIYYASPGPGQLGYRQMPHPPEEAEDPSVRPGGTPQIAWNCRCYLTPVLRPLEKERGTASGSFVVPARIPDPLVYGQWFAVADEKRRKIAVGSRSYNYLADQLSRSPQWADFLDPLTGRLLSKHEIEAETSTQRRERTAKVSSWLAELKRLATLTSSVGFVPV